MQGERGQGRTADRVIGLAVRALPRGEPRERYRQEFLADLHHLDRHRRFRYALGVVVQVVPLRFALARSARTVWEAAVGPRRRKPLLCLLNLRHRWVVESVEDGSSRNRTCVRCGKDFFVRRSVFPGI